MNEIKINGKLVDAEALLNELFSDGCRPSLRWLRTQTKAKTIPHVLIGHLVFFDRLLANELFRLRVNNINGELRNVVKKYLLTYRIG